MSPRVGIEERLRRCAPGHEIGLAPGGVWSPWLASAVIAFVVLEIWAVRSQPRLDWATAVLTMVFGAPVFHAGTLVLLFRALVPSAYSNLDVSVALLGGNATAGPE